MLQKIKGTAGRFLRDTRGGATSIAAVAVTIMTMGGAALIIDHNHLVGQRDILKSASDAASLAATLELNKLPDTLDDDEVRDRILPIARKYATLNVLGNVSDPDITADNVSIAFDINRGLGIVGATVEADTGKTLMSSWLYGYFGPGTVSIESGVETSETTVEVVLAIDISNSMHTNLAGDDVGHEDPESRMSIVKQAAADLVTILAPPERRFGRRGGNRAMGRPGTPGLDGAGAMGQQRLGGVSGASVLCRYIQMRAREQLHARSRNRHPAVYPAGNMEGMPRRASGDRRTCEYHTRVGLVRSSIGQGVRPRDLPPGVWQSVSMREKSQTIELRQSAVLWTERR